MKLIVPLTLFISLIIKQFANAQGPCANNIAQCTSCGLNTISPNLNNICTGCKTGFYLSYYSKCFSCALGCAVCQNQSPLNCSSCLDGYYLINTQCLSCSQSIPLTISGLSYSGITGCAICNAPTSGAIIPTCTQCSSGYLISGNSCIACPSGCAICSSSTTCTVCSLGFTLLTNGLCSSCLYQGQSISGCGVCDISNTTCLGCQGAQTLASSTVTTCTNLTNTQAKNCFIQGSSQNCAVCIGGYYVNNGKCSLCPTGCVCTSSNYCTSCSFGYLLIGSVCMLCSNTTSTSIGNFNYTGEAGCNICNVVVNTNNVTCTQCQDGYFSVNGSCASCGTITKQLINKAFYYGLANCAICSLVSGNNATCTQCNSGYFLNVDTGICNSCSDNCVTCDNIITCSVCSSQSYLASNGSCMNGVSVVSNCYISNTTWMCLQCSPGYFYKTSQCMSCLPNCIQCNNNSYCITCATNYTTSLFNGSCIPMVLTTFYNMNSILFNDKSFGLMIILIIYFLVNH